MEGPPDRLELVIRFVCGFLVGCGVANRLLGGGGLLAGLLFGLLAAWLGDRFWNALSGLFPWRR